MRDTVDVPTAGPCRLPPNAVEAGDFSSAAAVAGRTAAAAGGGERAGEPLPPPEGAVAFPAATFRLSAVCSLGISSTRRGRGRGGDRGGRASVAGLPT
mmetsp:Transcript_135917/g.434860  ORF Transcript_135917/g.434860 Transcript_135917/m.434860 type:complete len:98 (+) Transcript_135917:1092-1385(+)